MLKRSVQVCVLVRMLNYQEDRKRSLEEEYRTIAAWVSPLNFSLKQQDISNARTAGTGKWFLESDCFKRWLNGTAETDKRLWCYGMRKYT